MASAGRQTIPFETVAELIERLGDIPPERIRMKPLPGKAREKDILAAEALAGKRLCELIDGVLVEKPVGARESELTLLLGALILAHAQEHDLGAVLGADGMVRLFPGQVRIPDLSFISRERLPNGEVPDTPILDVAPNLAIEMLSISNTKREMERKLRDYFFAGVDLVWLIDPRRQTAEVYTSPTELERIGKTGTLDGGTILPGFRLPLKQLFARSSRRKGR